MKALIVVVLLAAAGVAVFLFLAGGDKIDVGASPSDPLGKFAAVEKRLLGLKMKKEPAEVKRLPELFGKGFQAGEGSTVFEYLDQVQGMKHFVSVVQSADGRIVAVGSRFRSGSFGFSKLGTKPETFISRYWIALAGKEPNFEKKMEGGADRQEYLEATLARSAFTASWRKDGAGGIVALPHEISDTVVFVVK